MLNIFIVGDGGIGSNLSVPLIKFLVFWSQKENITGIRLTICDGDKVEAFNDNGQPKNLLRQHYLPEDHGKKKANITTQHLRNICWTIRGEIQIESYPHYIKEDNVNIIQENDIILCGVDNHVTKVLLQNHLGKLKNGLLIIGANDYHDGDINILHRENGKWTTPLLTKKHPEVLKEAKKYPDELSCEEGSLSSPQLIIANITAAQGILEALYSFLLTKKVPYHQKYFDNQTGNVRIER